MYIVAIAWLYVVLMMSVTENSVIAAVMTFVFYGFLPVLIILYLTGTPQRKRNRLIAEQAARKDSDKQTEDPGMQKPDN